METDLREIDTESALPAATQASDRPRVDALAAAMGASAALVACGGGGGSAPSSGSSSGSGASSGTGSGTGTGTGSGSGSGSGAGSGSSSGTISDNSAARFLMQAGLGVSRTQISKVQSLGFQGWLSWQFSNPAITTNTRWLWLSNLQGASESGSLTNFDQGLWRKLIQAPDSDELRQRTALALSEIMVVSIAGLPGNWLGYTASAYMDLLEANAFGNFRTLMQVVSTSVAMGQYLTFVNNVKANPKTGSIPDENYARELMQLFTIGLVQLNIDGTPKLVNGQTVATYGQADVMGMAQVMTGWVLNDTSNQANYQFTNLPLIQNPANCDTSVKSFLGTTIPAGTDGATSLGMALDTVFAHPNVAPFISKQLIQRLVTSNPSSAYVTRVATVFNNDGGGVKGNLQAVLQAILLDTEARNDSAAASSPTFGKLREPMLRFLGWARAYRNQSNDGSSALVWNLGSTANFALLGQSPMRSPTVFNFFYPNYAPSGAIGSASLVAPEFQISNESSVVGFVNFMQSSIGTTFNSAVQVDYSTLTNAVNGAQALINNPAALVAELNITLAAGNLSAATQSQISTTLSGISNLTNRLYACIVLVVCAPESAVQK